MALDFQVSSICFGTAPLGGMPEVYGYSVETRQAVATLTAILSGPVPFLDTSRNYGLGRSEALIGRALRDLGGPPAGFLISTKLDRDMETGRFDADQARRSLAESLEALGLDRVDILHLHDPEYAGDLSEVTRKGGALDTLFRMKEEGVARAVGLAMGKIELMTDLLENWPFDALITHNRFTLLNRQAEATITRAHQRGMAVFNAAPYSGGVLAKGTGAVRRYVYQEADAATLAPAKMLEAICARHRIPLGAAALQFSLRDRRVTSTICGVSRPERVTETLDWSQTPVPEAAWNEFLAQPFSTEDPEANRFAPRS